jgi:hypothetical protein
MTLVSVFIDVMFVVLVGFYVLAAVKLRKTNLVAAIAAALGALHWIVIGTVAHVAALAGHTIKRSIWLVLLAVIGSTLLRVWWAWRARQE